jgi:hypothetical protein
MAPIITGDHDGVEHQFSTVIHNQLEGVRAIPDGTGANYTGGTPNHYYLSKASAYISNPGKYRQLILDALDYQWANGHCSHADADEFGTNSHSGWHYNAWAAVWVAARKAGHQDVIKKVIRWWRAEQRHNMLHRTPSQRVVCPGGRHFGGPNADQRVIRDRVTAFLNGENVRINDTVKQSLDWMGLWALTMIPRPEMLEAMKGLTNDDLPPTKTTLQVTRGKAALLSIFIGKVHMLDPAYWAYANFVNGDQKYGHDDKWGKMTEPTFDSPAGLPANLKPPAAPTDGGRPITYPKAKAA